MKSAISIVLFMTAAFLSALCIKFIPNPFLAIHPLWIITFALTGALLPQRWAKLISLNLCFVSLMLMILESA